MERGWWSCRRRHRPPLIKPTLGGVVPAALSSSPALPRLPGCAASESDSDVDHDPSANPSDEVRWRIRFKDDRRVEIWRDGFVYVHPRSSWTTVRDEEHDILVGRYLDAGEMIQSGMRLRIDFFEILVLDCLQVSSSGEEQIEIVDLTTSEHQITRPNPGIGGRFWMLVDDEEEDVEDRHSVAAKDPKETVSSSSLGADVVAPSSKFLPGERCKHKSSAPRSATGCKPTAMAIKAWKGPLPKVSCLMSPYRISFRQMGGQR
ncbi:hypothetical protein ACQJBY_010122 [Aegilops geniculata]